MNNRASKARRVVTPALPLAKNPNKQFAIEFVLDETGSMQRVLRQTVAGFNQFVEEQRAQSGDCRLSLTKFESSSLRTPYENLPISYVPEMNVKTFCPGGGTNLYDAVGLRIDRLAERLGEWKDHPDVLFVVMTDGEDNGSRYFNAKMVADLVHQHRKLGWAFAYLGAGRSAHQIGLEMGFTEGEIRTFDQVDIADTFRDFSTATTVYRSSRTAGDTTSTVFR